MRAQRHPLAMLFTVPAGLTLSTILYIQVGGLWCLGT